jgi:hypothetical protein
MTRVGVESASVAERLWRIAILTAAGTLGCTADAHATRLYWADSDPGFSRLERVISHQSHKARRHQVNGIEASQKEPAKPRGPLIIAISIQQQKLRIYDANGFFAETPISTGMTGHPTPMGVFSVIQKHKWHRSNIYSGAPMPYMQRITWSGVAMHAGVLPGYPASHGCIRMPTAFAIKMWNWTKMGARVVVTPGELKPASFSHPLLAAQKVMPQPSAAADPAADAAPGAKSNKAAAADAAAKSAIAAVNLELRTSIGHRDSVTAVMDEPSASAALRGQTHTADAGDLAAVTPSATMTDTAPPSGGSPRQERVGQTQSAPAIVEDASSVKADAKPDVNSGTAKSEAEPTAAHTSEMPSSEHKPGESLPSAADAKADNVKTVASKPDAPKADGKPDAIKADIGSNIPDLTKGEVRLPESGKPAVQKPDAATAATPKRSGQIAVFVSRKDSRLYVRQNFAPLFDAAVTIAPGDRPLGTHVFTAQVDKDDANVLHWSVVSLPVPRHAERHDEDERRSRRRKIAGAVEIREAPLPDSPAEALDRLTIPADAMARITEALTTGGSIIVSDQGINAGETGEGTDFIVSLR